MTGVEFNARLSDIPIYPAAETYEKELRDCDEHVELANAKSLGFSEKKRQVRLAIQSYRNAAAASPASAVRFSGVPKPGRP